MQTLTFLQVTALRGYVFYINFNIIPNGSFKSRGCLAQITKAALLSALTYSKLTDVTVELNTQVKSCIVLL